MKGDAERWIGIRWEFMREDPKYIEAFARLIKIESNNTDRGILFAESKKSFRNLALISLGTLTISPAYSTRINHLTN